MAKGLPYFKFVSTEWLTGNISLEALEIQGLYINICALYWQRDGRLELSEVEHRYKRKVLIAKLSDRFLKITDGFISIDFLDEQLTERQQLSKTNKMNGQKGGRPSSEEKKPKKSNIEEEKKENREEQEEEREIATPQRIYFIGADKIFNVKEFLEKNFRPLMTDLKMKYGEGFFNEWVSEFEEMNIQKNWKDNQDVRTHITSFLRKKDENKPKHGNTITKESTRTDGKIGSFGTFN